MKNTANISFFGGVRLRRTLNRLTVKARQSLALPLLFLLLNSYFLILTLPVHAGTNAAVTFNTNTGALSLPTAPAFYAANPPPGVTNALTNASQFVAATNGVAAGLVATNGMTVSAGGNTATLTLAGIGMGAITNLVKSYPGGLYLGTLQHGILVDINGNVWAGAFIGSVGASNLTGQINPANLPAMPFVNVLQYGVTNDGVTDVTANLQNLLNQGGALYFPPGRYLSQELQITNNTALLFNGATLAYAMNAWNTNIFIREMLNTNISIFGKMELDGQMYPNITTNTFQTYLGKLAFTLVNALKWNYWYPMGLRHGFQFNTESGGTIDQVTVHGFNGIGVLPLSISGIGSEGTPKASVGAMNCYSNLVGFYSAQPFTAAEITNWVTNYVPNALSPEYMGWSKVTCGMNTVGMTFEAANCTLADSDISDNYINDLEFGGSGNDHHGTISGTMFNHSTLIPLIAAGGLLGEIYSHCQFRGNSINNGFVLSGCAGWVVEDCMFDEPLAITNEGTPPEDANFFINNLYSGAWSSVSLSTDSQLVYYGNQSYTVFGDNDGQPMTLGGLTITGNAGITMTGPGSVIDGGTNNGFGNTTISDEVGLPGPGALVLTGPENTDTGNPEYGILLTGEDSNNDIYWTIDVYGNFNGVIGFTNGLASYATNRLTGYSASSAGCTNTSTFTEEFDVMTTNATLVKFDNAGNPWDTNISLSATFPIFLQPRAFWTNSGTVTITGEHAF